MALILCIETATERCSVGIGKDGQAISLQETEGPYDHAERINLLIEAALAEAGNSFGQLDAIAVSEGPGSYTGLRIGMSTAKGLCYALEKPLITISTLRALAVGIARVVPEADLLCPMIDARRMEVYTAVYDRWLEEVQPVGAMVLGEAGFPGGAGSGKVLAFGGNGALKARELLESTTRVFTEVVCSAEQMMPLAESAFREKDFASPAYAEPFYLKPPNITKPNKLL